ncbi:MAG: hypothetical protein AB1469_06630 [Pseudomonadota bacterium]
MENFGSWSILTTNFLIVLYMAVCGVLLCALLQMANAKWRVHVRKLAVSLAALFPVAFVLLLILLANGEATFHWLKTAHEGEQHLPGWHNYTFLVARQIIGFLVVAALFGLFIKYQYKSEIDNSYRVQRTFRNIALLIPFAYVPYATMVAWDFEMTMRPGWHSASYGAYHFVSNFGAFLGFFSVFLFFLNRSGKLAKPLPEYVFNYMAQFMFAFTILWTYLFFTQYLIMWYGRLPEEMVRFNSMMFQGYGAIWWTFFTLKFIIPFTTFLFTANRHSLPVIATVGGGILLGTWLERYTWISGSVDSAFYHIPMTAVFDIVATLIVFGVAWFAVRWSLNRYGLVKP